MDYKAIAEQLEKIADSDPAVIAEWAAVIRTKYLKNAANAITDLLARAEAAEARAEKAEGERDAAIKQLHGVCSACAHYSPYHNDGLCATYTHEVACFLPEKATDKWEWNGGQKEE